MNFVSIATLKNNEGKAVFIRARHERPDHVTQARKSASRYWRGTAKERGWQLLTVYCVTRSPNGFEVHERMADNRSWSIYPAPERPSPQVAACIEELGGEPPDLPLPETLIINGWQYHRGNYVGDL